MSTESTGSESANTPHPPEMPDATIPAFAAAPHPEVHRVEAILAAMGVAVQTVAMYNSTHPSAIKAVALWMNLLSPRLRVNGTFTIGTDGRVALVDGIPFATANPVIQVLLRKLYTSRAGELQMLSGMGNAAASRVAECLSIADEHDLAEDENSLGAWIDRYELLHIQVNELLLREIKESDRVLDGSRQRSKRPRAPSTSAADRDGSAATRDAHSWAKRFERESKLGAAPPVLPSATRDSIAAHLRGKKSLAPVQLARAVTRAAEHTADLAELILKVAVVRHEIERQGDGPVGPDIVTCLRSILDAMLASPDARSNDGLANLARTLAVIESALLDRLSNVAGGSVEDADAVREGVRSMQRHLEGLALKYEYRQRRSALSTVEERVKRFFGVEDLGSIDAE